MSLRDKQINDIRTIVNTLRKNNRRILSGFVEVAVNCQYAPGTLLQLDSDNIGNYQFNNRALLAIAKVKKLTESRYIFANEKTGKPLTPQWVSRAIYQACDQNHISRIPLKEFRILYGRDLYRHGATLKFLRQMYGKRSDKEIIQLLRLELKPEPKLTGIFI